MFGAASLALGWRASSLEVWGLRFGASGASGIPDAWSTFNPIPSEERGVPAKI